MAFWWWWLYEPVGFRKVFAIVETEPVLLEVLLVERHLSVKYILWYEVQLQDLIPNQIVPGSSGGTVPVQSTTRRSSDISKQSGA